MDVFVEIYKNMCLFLYKSERIKYLMRFEKKWPELYGMTLNRNISYLKMLIIFELFEVKCKLQLKDRLLIVAGSDEQAEIILK